MRRTHYAPRAVEDDPLLFAQCPGDEPPEVCMFCAKVVDDRRFAVTVAVRPEWERGAYGLYIAHVECLRRAIHDSIGF